MTSKLAKHVKVTKVVTRFTSKKGPALKLAILQNLPYKVALIASRMTCNFLTTEKAVMEYLTAEILELSRYLNAARGCDLEFISCRHVLLASQNDEELNRQLENSAI